MKLHYLLPIAFCFSFCISVAQTDNPETFKNHVTYLASRELEGRGLGTKGKDLATAYIKEQFITAGLKPFNENYLQEFSLKFDLARVTATNIIGVVEGTDPILKNEYIVLGAHYDHLGYILTKKNDHKIIYPGADDNASGVAAIIELAKHFNKPENRTKRSIIFIAFDAEESGLLGAKHFVKTADETILKNIKAMFSFDMVGMLKANKGLNLKGIKTLENGKEIVERHSGDIELFKVNSDIEERTDTKPFGAKGIPSIHVFTGTKSPYHLPLDTADLLDYEGIVKVTHFMANVVTEIGNQSEELEAISFLNRVRENEKAVFKRFQTGIVFNLGSGAHLYKDEFFNAKSAFAYSTGLQMNYKLTRVIHFNLEALYDYNTSKSANGTFKRHSATIPFNVEFGTPTNSGKSMRAFIFGGVYYRYNFDGKLGGTSLDFENTYRENEWGYNFGFGADIYKVRIGFTLRSAFDSILQDGEKIYQSSGYFTLGYKF